MQKSEEDDESMQHTNENIILESMKLIKMKN